MDDEHQDEQAQAEARREGYIEGFNVGQDKCEAIHDKLVEHFVAEARRGEREKIRKEVVDTKESYRTACYSCSIRVKSHSCSNSFHLPSDIKEMIESDFDYLLSSLKSEQ